MAFFHSAFYDLPTSVRKIPALQAAGPMTQRDFRNDLMSQAWPVDDSAEDHGADHCCYSWQGLPERFA
jgi:hypothetical protein